MERLQKIIANSGFCSRRKAEELITKGLVRVNGEKVTDLGTKAKTSDIITIAGKTLKNEDKEYILLYKPRGVVSTTSDDKGRKTVISLIDTDKRLYPIGRLDYDTSGLLILTNDGELTNLLTHPKNEITKEYIVKIDEAVNPTLIKKLSSGIIIDGEKMKADRVKIKKRDKKKKKTIIEIVLHEGKYHEIKRMFACFKAKVIELNRIGIGDLYLPKDLKIGDVREVTKNELLMIQEK